MNLKRRKIFGWIQIKRLLNRGMENAVKCMEPKFKSCPNGMERAMEGIKKFCMDSGTELG